MIEKMKMVHVVTSASKREKMLGELRDLSLLHLADRKSADRASIDKFNALAQTANSLQDYAPDEKEKGSAKAPVLSDAEFEKLDAGVQKALSRKSELAQEKSNAEAEIERIREWGNFAPADVKSIKKAGYDFHFYRLDRNTFDAVMSNPDIKAVRLADVDKMATVAVLGTLPADMTATEFILPEKGMDELQATIRNCEAENAECDEVLKNAAVYSESYQAQMLKAQNEQEYSSARETTEGDNDFVWISGYLPASDADAFKAAASRNGWAYAMDDVADDDENVPTKLKYGKVSRLIQPLYNILGILPGYREQDVSIWFLLFFTLFFAMIIGDAGYGFLVLAATVVIHCKLKKEGKKAGNGTFLLYVLSIATIIWGAITGTWFGMESAMKVPFLRAIVLPCFANYPEYFGYTSAQQQNAIMAFSFSIGAIQMSLGSILSIRKKISEKNLSWLCDLGWMICVISMYLLALYLVIGVSVISIKPIFACIIVAFLMVVVFGGMSPDKTFAQGLKAGLADAFTDFLNTISCFGNVMSYIRLFAVGMAGLAISQSFNGIAANFHGALIVFAVIVVIIGHALNIVMCFLSVAVHGVRLNVLEFSGQVGLEWTGFAYDPFKINTKIKK